MSWDASTVIQMFAVVAAAVVVAFEVHPTASGDTAVIP